MPNEAISSRQYSGHSFSIIASMLAMTATVALNVSPYDLARASRNDGPVLGTFRRGCSPTVADSCDARSSESLHFIIPNLETEHIERRTQVLRQLGSRANGFGALLLSGGLCGLEGGKGFDGNAGELGVLLGGELFEVLDRLGKF